MLRALLKALPLLALVLPGPVTAQTYPSKPVKIVVPFPAGGGVDALGRIVQPGLQEKLGQPIIVENKPGAAGTIGTEFAINQPKDGYTILIGSPAAITVAPSLNRKLPYDPMKDLVPLTMGVRMPNLLVVHPSVQAANVQELVALAKAQPGKLTFASGGIGTNQQLSGELFKITAKVDMLHVPYKGTSPALADLVSGQVLLSFTDPSVLEQVKAGKLRLLAQTSATRSPLYPDVPTVAEQGFAGFNAVNWYGFFAPAGTPDDIVARLSKDLMAVLELPDIKEKLIKAGMNPEPSTPAQFKAFLAEDTKRWSDVVTAAGIKID